MIQELADHIWDNSRFHEAAARTQRTWLARELGKPIDDEVAAEDAVKLMEAAAVLACSSDAEHRRQAYRAATMTYEILGSSSRPMQQALRVVLNRLGNFPAIETRVDVRDSASDLPFDLLVEELAFSDKHRVLLRERPVFLTGFQHQLWQKLGNRKSLAVAAPTSAGKSFVLQGHLARIFSGGDDNSVVYLVPTRALIAQVARDLTSIFVGQKEASEIITIPLDADQQLPKRSVLVMTQERVQLMLLTHASLSPDIIIVDEAHSIADRGRGVLLQWVIDDMLRRKPDAQLLFASPGIRNLDVFGRTFGLNNVETIPSAEPTVAQNFLIVRVTSSKTGEFSVSSVEPNGQEVLVRKFETGRTLASRKDRLVHLSALLGKDSPSIVYANGAAEAEDFAIQLAELLAERESTSSRESVATLVKESVHPSYVLAGTVLRGVGFHYSNMPTHVRQAVEDAFTNGALDFLVCTSTLLQGVNLPAKNVFMCKPEKGRTRPLEGTDFWNLAGRAGRLQREFQGNIFLIDYDDWKTQPLNQPKDLEIVPAVEAGISERSDDLVATMRDTNGTKRENSDLETLFVKLLDDHTRGELPMMLSRLTDAGVPRSTTSRVGGTVEEVAASLTIPVDVIRQSPNLSPHRQQSLHGALLEAINSDEAFARRFIPAHPRESNAYDSYVQVLRWCNTHLLGLPQTDRRHIYHALMALFWMKGTPLPQIIENAISRNTKHGSRRVIRDTLDTIEKVIRFEIVRLMSCYCAVLVRVFQDAGFPDLSKSIPTLSLYLEVGASDRTMISFIGLGLSRVAAAILNDAAVNKGMTVLEARNWLANTNLDAYDMSPLLREEITVALR